MFSVLDLSFQKTTFFISEVLKKYDYKEMKDSRGYDEWNKRDWGYIFMRLYIDNMLQISM